MTLLSPSTTRNSLTKSSTRGSTLTRTSTRESAQGKKPGFLSKLKHAFGGRGSSRDAASESGQSAFSEEDSGDDRPPSQLTVPGSSRRRRRSSVFNRSKSREARDVDAERELEERKSRCMAIKVAKRDPPAVQRLLVDCEFCNPPPKFGRDIDVPSAGFTADDAAAEPPVPGVDAANELAWNRGLEEWTRIRRWWLSPTVYAVPTHHLDPDLTPDKFYTVYDKMVYQTRPLKHPLNLDDMLQIVKAGWVGEGTWPAQDNPEDVWSTSDAEEIKENAATGSGGQPRVAAAGSRFASPGPGVQTPPSSSISGVATAPSVKVSSPAPTHVQFGDLPHPKGADLQPTPSASRDSLPPLERLQSGVGSALKPVRSTQSSLVSLTDSE